MPDMDEDCFCVGGNADVMVCMWCGCIVDIVHTEVLKQWHVTLGFPMP